MTPNKIIVMNWDKQRTKEEISADIKKMYQEFRDRKNASAE